MDYLESLKDAIDYIENHLDEAILPEDIARAAGYSLYHLSHIFTAVIGEPIGSYIQKRRLSLSCQTLLYSEKRIIDIALESGFSSSEAYSRAFKTIYGMSPIVYRKNKLNRYIGSKKRLNRDELEHITANLTIKPQFVEIEQIFVVGIRGETSTEHNVLPELWSKMLTLCQPVISPPSSRGFGICETNNSTLEISQCGSISFCEFVGIEVEHFNELPNGTKTKIIPGGRYAVFTHKGSITNLRKTFDYIYGSWALFTKEILDDREDFEVYDQRFLGQDNDDSQIDIYIPVK